MIEWIAEFGEPPPVRWDSGHDDAASGSTSVTFDEPFVV